jgi:hypothetical protein
MSIELATKLRANHLPLSVIMGERASTITERTGLLAECVSNALPVISMGRAVGKVPASLQDKNWRGRALEAYLGGQSTSHAGRDFEDGELKSTRVLGSPGQWRIEQTLRITTLSHTSGAHLKPFEETPFYDKISCFSCVMFDSQKSDIESGRFVGTFVFRIDDDARFYSAIRQDYEFYLEKIFGSTRVTSRVKSTNGFLGCRQTAGKAGVESATSLYITPRKFNDLLVHYGVNH